MNDIVMYMYYLLEKKMKYVSGQNGRTNSYYRNDPKFSDRHVRANSADPDRTADQRLDCLPFRLHLLNALLYVKAAMSKFKGDYSKCLDVWTFRSFTVHHLYNAIFGVRANFS